MRSTRQGERGSVRGGARAPLRSAAIASLVAFPLLLACASDTTSGSSSGSALVALDALIAAHPVDKTNPEWRLLVRRPPPVPFQRDHTYYWMLFTNLGLMRIELMPESAPLHVSATMYLTRLGFYDGLTFHRVIPKFMAQGGDPTGTGKGGPGFRYGGEFPKHNTPHHDARGVVSMANAGPRTDGSQFFILFGEARHLDGQHTIFGKLVEGLGTLRLIEQLGTEQGTPVEPIVIERAEIREELTEVPHE